MKEEESSISGQVGTPLLVLKNVWRMTLVFDTIQVTCIMSNVPLVCPVSCPLQSHTCIYGWQSCQNAKLTFCARSAMMMIHNRSFHQRDVMSRWWEQLPWMSELNSSFSGGTYKCGKSQRNLNLIYPCTLIGIAGKGSALDPFPSGFTSGALLPRSLKQEILTWVLYALTHWTIHIFMWSSKMSRNLQIMI